MCSHRQFQWSLDHRQHRRLCCAWLALAPPAKFRTIGGSPRTAADIKFISLDNTVELVLACQHQAYSMTNPPSCRLADPNGFSKPDGGYSLIGLQDQPH